jgi:adenylate kinase
VLLSTHLAVETRAGFVHGLPDGVLQEVAPSMFVLVEADPGVILDRRAESDRDLTPVTERHVEFEQHLNRTAAVEYARDLDAPIQFVESEGPVTEAAAEIAETL